jgi:hypothetical protein
MRGEEKEMISSVYYFFVMKHLRVCNSIRLCPSHPCFGPTLIILVHWRKARIGLLGPSVLHSYSKSAESSTTLKARLPSRISLLTRPVLRIGGAIYGQFDYIHRISCAYSRSSCTYIYKDFITRLPSHPCHISRCPVVQQILFFSTVDLV